MTTRLLQISLNRSIKLSELLLEMPEILDYLRFDAVLPLMRTNHRLRDLLSLLIHVSVEGLEFRRKTKDVLSSKLDLATLLASPGRRWRVKGLVLPFALVPLEIPQLKDALRPVLPVLNFENHGKFSVDMRGVRIDGVSVDRTVLGDEMIGKIIACGAVDFSNDAETLAGCTEISCEALQVASLPTHAKFPAIRTVTLAVRLGSLEALERVTEKFPCLAHAELRFALGAGARFAELRSFASLPRSASLHFETSDLFIFARQLPLAQNCVQYLQSCECLHLPALGKRFGGDAEIVAVLNGAASLRRLSLVNSDLLPRLTVLGNLEDLCVLVEVDKIHTVFSFFDKKPLKFKRLHLCLDSADGMTRVPVAVEQALLGGFLTLAEHVAFVSFSVTVSPIMECVVMQLPWLFPAKFGLGSSVCAPAGQPVALTQPHSIKRPLGTLISDIHCQPPNRPDAFLKRMGLAAAADTLRAFYER